MRWYLHFRYNVQVGKPTARFMWRSHGIKEAGIESWEQHILWGLIHWTREKYYAELPLARGPYR